VWLLSVTSLVLLGLYVSVQPAGAQSGQQFVGHIEDSSHAVIPEATVTIHNEETGEDVVVKTTAAGDYTVPYLKTGLYTITARMAGFKEVSRTHITLSTDQSSKIDFILPVGAVSETVTVSSAGDSQVELFKADRGEIIDAERVQELPTDGRNVLELFELSPGTINNHNPQFTRPQDNVAGDLYANGGAVLSAPVQENLDGASNDNAAGFLGYPPPPDSVAEFKVVLNPYDASYGRAGGGAIDISLKSGSNRIHGDMYDYIRRPFMDAQSYQYDYNVSQGSTTQIPSRHSRDQFGLEADGPVVIPHIYNGKDKTFFLIQWEQAYENLPSTSATISSIPDPKWLTGDFSTAQFMYTVPSNAKVNVCGAGVTRCLQPLTIYDPNSPVTTVVDPLDGKTKRAHSAFANNMIPQGRLDSTGAAIAQFYGQLKPNNNPGAGYAPFQNNYYNLPLENDIARNGLIKISHNFGPQDRGTIRWDGFERFDTNPNNGIPASNRANQIMYQVQPKSNNFAIEEIHTFSPKLLLDNKLTLLSEIQGTYYGSRDTKVLSALEMSQHYIDNAAFTDIFPTISTSNPFGLIGMGGTPGTYSIAHNLAYQPSITWVGSRHTVRFGYDMRLMQLANPGNSVGNQSLTFTNTFTQHFTPASGDSSGFTSGSGLAAMLLGDPSGAYIKYSISPFYSQHYFAFWTQDDWKVTPKLTLNFGVRWDILTARTERHDKLNYAFDFTTPSPIQVPGMALTGGIRFAGVNGAPRGAYATNLDNIQPRFGVAYAFNDRTSLRVGFGEMFVNDEGNDSSNGFSSSATGYTSTVLDPTTDNTTPYGHLSDPFPQYVRPTGTSLGLATTPGSSVNFKNPQYRTPSVWEYSVSVQRLISSRDVLEVSYSGTKAYNLNDSLDFNHVSAAWTARCDVERTGVAGSRQNCDASTIGPAQVANPFKGIAAFSGTSYYTSSTLSTGALTRPYPQFTSITQDNSNRVHSWYNSLQVTASHRVAKSLTLHAAYTWSKTMKEGQVIDITNGVYGRSLSTNDTPQVLTFSGSVYLPLGRGRAILGSTNRLVDSIVGGWQLSPLYVYTSGKPWSPGNNWEWTSTTTKIGVSSYDLPADSTHAYKRLRGITPCVAYKDTDTGAIINGPAYVAAGCTAPVLVRTPNSYAIQHSTVSWGARLSAVHEFDASMSKKFSLNDKIALQTRLDAFNVLNHPNWTNGFNSDPTSLDWGTISKGPSGPGTPARDLQISGKLIW
jgi:hypothetical protein